MVECNSKIQFDLGKFESLLLQALGEEIKGWCWDSGVSCCTQTSLLSSWLQKSIRRGVASDAVRSVLSLHRDHPDYVWRRLRSIALEEVSVADLELVAQVLAVAGKRALQRKLGEHAVLTWLTVRLVNSPKCRTALDLFNWLPSRPLFVGSLFKHPEFVATRIWASEAPTLRQDAGMWMSTERRSVLTPAGWRTLARGSRTCRDLWLDASDIPPLVQYIVRRGNNTEGLNVLLVPVYQLCLAEVRTVQADPPPPTSGVRIDGLAAYAYCADSRTGRAALRHFLDCQPDWQRRFNRLRITDPVPALGQLLFQAEGGCRTRTLLVGRSEEIQRLSEEFRCAELGMPANCYLELQRQLVGDLPELNKSRRAVASGTGYGLYEK